MLEREGKDRVFIDLPPLQQKLAQAVLSVSAGKVQEMVFIFQAFKLVINLHDLFSWMCLTDLIRLFALVCQKVVLVLVNGGAVAIDNAADFPAIVEAFYPSMRGAEALFLALMGKANRWGTYSIFNI